MSRVCHECGTNVENPFYIVMAVLRDRESERLAFSNKEHSLCGRDFAAIEGDVLERAVDMPEALGYAFDMVTGGRGGFTGNVQMSSGVFDRHGQYQFLDRQVAAQSERCAVCASPWACRRALRRASISRTLHRGRASGACLPRRGGLAGLHGRRARTCLAQ